MPLPTTTKGASAALQVLCRHVGPREGNVHKSTQQHATRKTLTMCAWEVILIRRSGGCGRCGRTGFGTASAAFHTVSGLRDSAHTQNTPTVTQPRSHGSTSTSTSTTDGAQLYPAPTAVQTVHRAVSRHRVRRANAPHQSHTRAQDAGGSSTLTPSHAHTGRQCVQRTTVWGKVTPQWTLPTHTHSHTPSCAQNTATSCR